NYSYPDLSPSNEDILKELSACLSYDQLLPHLYGTKGINKVCIFEDRLSAYSTGSSSIKILGVAYPEAVRVGYQEGIHYIK
ncbi:MAG TPA: hypothetical protein VKZ84_00470, partial [Bacteriovoracaceae bacterium]|nr:hypothetical protein [Bacteriovoracaceae bacterium]